MNMSKTVVVLLLATIASCGKESKDAGKSGGGGGAAGGGGGGGAAKLDPASEYLLNALKKDISAVKDALATGGDPKYKCAGASTYAEELGKKSITEAEAPVNELKKLCAYDVPLAALEGATKKAEEARKAKPTDDPLSECYSAEHDTAIETLKKAGSEGDEKVKAVVARWDVACPPKK